MTALEFRSSPERVAAFRELLSNNPTLAQAIVVLRDEKPSAAVPSGSDAIECARTLGKLEQHEADLDTLLSLAEPAPIAPSEEEQTWGIDKNKFPQPTT